MNIYPIRRLHFLFSIFYFLEKKNGYTFTKKSIVICITVPPAPLLQNLQLSLLSFVPTLKYLFEDFLVQGIIGHKILIVRVFAVLY